MKLVHVTPFYPPVIGGVEKVAVNIIEHLAAKGTDAHVITYNRLRSGGAQSLPREEVINNVHVHRLRPNVAWSHGTYSTELRDVLTRLKPDIVHTHAWRHPHVFQVAKLKEKLGYRAIMHGHAPFHAFSQLGVTIWFYHRATDWLRKGVLSHYDILIALTPHEKEILTRELNCPHDKIVVVPNGIEDELANVPPTKIEGEPMLFYLGRICRSKNVDFLLKAAGFARRDVSGFRLVLAGPDESLVARLQNYALKHEISFQYAGLVSEKLKFDLYGKCAIFVHPAIYEPFGITLLEAQAFGKPCVITGEGGQEYAAPPGETSLHSEPNPEDYGKKISDLLNDRDLYRRMSINAKAWAKQHAWSNIVPKFEEVYDRL